MNDTNYSLEFNAIKEKALNEINDASDLYSLINIKKKYL